MRASNLTLTVNSRSRPHLSHRTYSLLYRIRFVGIVLLIKLHTNFVMSFSTPSPQTPKVVSSSSSSSSLANEENESLSLSDEEKNPYDNPKLYQVYEESMQQVLNSFRVTQPKDDPEDLEVAKSFLFSPKRFIPTNPANYVQKDIHDETKFRDHVNSQSTYFLETTKFSKAQKEMILRALTYIGDYCAKQQTSDPLHVAWDKVKEAGLRPRQNALGAYLYILSSLPSKLESDERHTTDMGKVNHESGGKESLLSSTASCYNAKDIAGEVAFYHDMLFKPTENTVSIRIKALVEQGLAAEAEALLWNLKSSTPDDKPSAVKVNKKQGKTNNNDGNARLRLRTCLPVLQLYMEKGDVSQGLKLYQKMRQAPSVHFEAETYVMILSSLAKRGYFCNDSSRIDLDGLADFGYEAGKGAKLFDVIAREMADDVLEITSDSAKEIRNSFVTGFGSSKSARNLCVVPYDCDLSSVSDAAADDELVANRITIDSNTTLCSRTNATLRLIQLEEHQRKHVHDTLIEMAETQFEAYESKLRKKGNKPSTLEENYAAKHLQGFADWLNERDGEPFTAIVDGANVAYYGLGSINYHQIKLMVTALEEMGETPLVVMPQKYTQKKFHLRQGYIQELPQSQIDILKELDQSGKFYKVPFRCLDDYYWMLSSVSNQNKSRDGVNLDVSPDDEQVRWPGTRPMLLTNDQMRDHKLELLEPRLFRRWSSSHIVNYHFPPFLNDAWEDREINFTPADIISREIQGNPSNSMMAWHFPVKNWDKNDRFCVRIPCADGNDKSC